MRKVRKIKSKTYDTIHDHTKMQYTLKLNNLEAISHLLNPLQSKHSNAMVDAPNLEQGPLPLSQWTLNFAKITREMLKPNSCRNIIIEIKLHPKVYKKYSYSSKNNNRGGLAYKLVCKDSNPSNNDQRIQQEDVTFILYGDRYKLSDLMKYTNFSHLQGLLSHSDCQLYQSFVTKRRQFFHPHRDIKMSILNLTRIALSNNDQDDDKAPSCTSSGHKEHCFPSPEDFLKAEDEVTRQYKLPNDTYQSISYGSKLALNIYTRHYCYGVINKLLRLSPINDVIIEETYDITIIIQQINEILPAIAFANLGISLAQTNLETAYGRRYENFSKNKNEIEKRIFSYQNSLPHHLMGFNSTTAVFPTSPNNFSDYCSSVSLFSLGAGGLFIKPFSVTQHEIEFLFPPTQVIYEKIIEEENETVGKKGYYFLAKPVRSLTNRANKELIPAKLNLLKIIANLSYDPKFNRLITNQSMSHAIASAHHVFEVATHLQQKYSLDIASEITNRLFNTSRNNIYYAMVAVIFFKLYGEEAADKLEEYNEIYTIFPSKNQWRKHRDALKYINSNPSVWKNQGNNDEIIALAAIIQGSINVAENISMPTLNKTQQLQHNFGDNRVGNVTEVECWIKFLINDFPPSLLNPNYRMEGIVGLYNDLFFDTTEIVLSERELQWCDNLFATPEDTEHLIFFIKNIKQFQISCISISQYLNGIDLPTEDLRKERLSAVGKSLYFALHAALKDDTSKDHLMSSLQLFFQFISHQSYQLINNLLKTIDLINQNSWNEELDSDGNNDYDSDNDNHPIIFIDDDDYDDDDDDENDEANLNQIDHTELPSHEQVMELLKKSLHFYPPLQKNNRNTREIIENTIEYPPLIKIKLMLSKLGVTINSNSCLITEKTYNGSHKYIQFYFPSSNLGDSRKLNQLLEIAIKDKNNFSTVIYKQKPIKQSALFNQKDNPKNFATTLIYPEGVKELMSISPDTTHQLMAQAENCLGLSIRL